MPVWSVVLLVAAVFALVAAAVFIILRRFSDKLFGKFKAVKPKIIIYRPEKESKEDK